MSLLNQVLQDLEKRSDDNVAERFSQANIKVVKPTENKSFYLAFSIILIISVIVISSYLWNENKSSANDVIADHAPANLAKQQVTAKAKIIQIKIPEKKKQSIERLDISQLKTASSQIVDKNTKYNNPEKQQTIKPSITQIETGSLALSQADKKHSQKIPVVKKISHQQKAEQRYQHAQTQQNIKNRQLDLEQTLIFYPQHINARLLLAKTLLQQGLTDKAAQILEQGLGLFPQNLQLINFRSQLLLQQNQAQAALKILNQVEVNTIQNETYLSLLAAAYQQDNDSFSSLQSYKKLLKINPEKAEYWLGLAIALEKQNNLTQALTAYQQALDKNTLKMAIVSYIEQRISILK